MDRTIRLPVAALAVALSASLGACATTPPPLPPPAAQCVAEPAAWAIGRAPTDDVLARIQSDTHSALVRVIRPGDAVTMDYSDARVNVKVNERNAIVGINCG